VGQYGINFSGRVGYGDINPQQVPDTGGLGTMACFIVRGGWCGLLAGVRKHLLGDCKKGERGGCRALMSEVPKPTSIRVSDWVCLESFTLL